MDWFSAISKAELKQKSQWPCKINYSGIRRAWKLHSEPSLHCLRSPISQEPWWDPALQLRNRVPEEKHSNRRGCSFHLPGPPHSLQSVPSLASLLANDTEHLPTLISVATGKPPSSSDSNTCIPPTKKPATLFFLMKIPKEVQLRVLISWIYGKPNISNNYNNLLKYKHLMKVKRKLVSWC